MRVLRRTGELCLYTKHSMKHGEKDNPKPFFCNGPLDKKMTGSERTHITAAGGGGGWGRGAKKVASNMVNSSAMT